MSSIYKVKGIYLASDLKFQLKNICCKYHITLRELMKCLFYNISSEVYNYGNITVSNKPRKQLNIHITEGLYNSIKIMANNSHMKLNDFINLSITRILKNSNIQTIILNWTMWKYM